MSDHKTSDPVSMHTPGPWTVEDPMSFELAIVEEGKTPAEWGFVACLPFKDQDDPSDNDFPSEVVRANARLIAAAPELLKALKKVIALSDRKHDAWDAAHAAIAKAEGRS